MTERRYAQWVAETVRVRLKGQPWQTPRISTPGDLARWAMPLYETLSGDQEHFTIVALNARNVIQGYRVVSSGTLSTSLVGMREVFAFLIEMRAAAGAAIHNHPSGDCEPSTPDRDITCRLQAAGELLGIPIVDHVVLGGGDWVSFAARGLL